MYSETLPHLGKRKNKSIRAVGTLNRTLLTAASRERPYLLWRGVYKKDQVVKIENRVATAHRYNIVLIDCQYPKVCFKRGMDQAEHCSEFTSYAFKLPFDSEP